ncbi:hypothetical protein EHEL_090255 [Encephalitozoon hellem ATCC 50504]|uniref:Uncharacterized protein n=1 Tax=Encephalitozoon hellem TaxID=27973 RepID=A0A9Q9C4D7_ENCHE|nr:uncharacterized protein EHEL_090255 [Encephalitozoon hellem ATCC 50504]AHL28964.1 hypothetical protein EHEL_090255 [Encephalitozoon hellem ATCC 50504]UTX43934.1 hypothetical protein GPU96_09g17140 [Encephalitozoon hellem]WEL39418.1 hypothetical protein PFJ87_09g00450 [Encephalitozoon hellem]
MDKDSLEKFQAQISVLSAKEIEKTMKRLSKDEFDMFIDVLENYNMDLAKDLEQARNDMRQRLENHKMLFECVWDIIPGDVRRHLMGYYRTMSDIL